jgi:hypothetical protein
MYVRVVKTRQQGIEQDRRVLRETYGLRGTLSILDVTDQGLRRPTKVARLMMDGVYRYEMSDVGIVWAADGRFTLSGFERVKDEYGNIVEYRQAWLCILDTDEKPIRGD